MTIGEKIKALRLELNLSQEELAKKLGYKSKTSIFKIENGITDLTQSKIVEIAKILNTTPNFLMNLNTQQATKKTTPSLSFNKKEVQKSINNLHKSIDNLYKELDALKNKLELNEDAIYNIKNYFTVKCFGQVSAGTGVVLDDEYAEDIDIDFNPPKHDYALKINGDSMEPAFADGQIIFVKQQHFINNGEFGIFILDGQGYFKKYSIDYEKKKAVLISLNDKYEDIDLSEYEDVRCVGKVIV